jgi:predicted phosphodiesterase
MKLAIASDLHLEFQNIKLTNTEEADVLILAGDICTVKHFHSRVEMEKAYYEFFKNCSEQFKHVLYVLGNHEHYNYQFNYTVLDLKRKLADFSNIYVLDNETFELDNKTFIGSTLWTDMNNECPLTMNAAQFAMPDFKIVKYYDGVNYRKYSPEQSVKEHYKSLQYIKNVIRNCNDKDHYLERDVIVVTHHSPSHRSIHPKYKHEELMNGAFHNNLDYMMELADNIKLWVHGHTHDEFDYTIGITRVVCNPRGYPKENQHGSFKLKYVEV